MTQMDTTVDTVEGTVDGKRGRRSRRGTVSWLGIPYAAPPVGPLRLRAPQPVQPWDGVLECFDYGFSPIQDKLFTARADGTFQPRSEDCLTVNVFAPDYTPPNGESLPDFNARVTAARLRATRSRRRCVYTDRR